MEYHEPVLLRESIEGLNIRKGGLYVDATFGGGGHSRAILNALGTDGRLIGFDQDGDARQNVPEDERFSFVHGNFKHLKRYLKYLDVGKVDGVLADLGVSSHQFDTASKGFSYRFDSVLDMRMNKQQELDAITVLNSYNFENLVRVFSELGEVRNAKTLASKVVERRLEERIRTVGQLQDVVEECRRGNPMRYSAQVYQSLRMEVNDEVGVLKTFLCTMGEVLKKKGRLVVIAYHSIEDREVKKAISSMGRETEDGFGGSVIVERFFKWINKKPILASDDELKRNPRARSARLRIAERK